MSGIRLLPLLLFMLPLLSAAGAAPQSTDDPIDPFGFHESDYSTWGIVDAPYPYDPAAPPPAGSGRVNAQGCFPVGNGIVFAALGLDGDFNTLTNLCGPGYQTRDEKGEPVYWQAGAWPEIRVQLVRAPTEQQLFPNAVPPDPLAIRTAPWEGQATDFMARADGSFEFETLPAWQRQSIRQLRGAAIVRTVQQNSEYTLYCLTYAVPDEGRLVREFAVRGPLKAERLALRVMPARPFLGDDRPYLRCGDKRLIITGAGSAGYPRDGFVYISGEPEPDATGVLWRIAQSIMLTETNDELPALGHTVDPQLRQQTYDYWQKWSSHNLKFATGDQRLDDLMAQVPVIIECQRDAASGGVAPMVSYHGYWVRDSLGPIYTYLLNGRLEEVERMLRYHRKACWKLQNCSMLVPLDVDVSDVREPAGRAAVSGRHSADAAENQASAITGRDAHAPKEETWDAVPVEHAEVPSLIVLQHYWLWQALRAAGREGDADAFIAEAWPFITHNLFTMQFDSQYGVKFHGDETYTHGALYSTFDSGLPGMLGWPNGYIPTDFFSFDNTLLHCGAALALREMAQTLGDPAAAEQAGALHTALLDIVRAYRQGGSPSFSPAISATTHALWPQPFANIGLAPWSLGIPWSTQWEDLQGLYLGSAYGSQKDALYGYERGTNQQGATVSGLQHPQSAISWWTTPWSGFATGHALGSWLNAARSCGDASACENLVRQLLQTATPEGAWCEVYDPQGCPVNVYGRVNRIRTWESGINYAMLAAYLAQQQYLEATGTSAISRQVLNTLTLAVDPVIRQEEAQSAYIESLPPGSPERMYNPAWFGYYTNAAQQQTIIPGETQLLVLTRDNHYLDKVRLDRRLAALTPEQICVWDIALPLWPSELRLQLLTGMAALGQDISQTAAPAPTTARVPCLYLDRDVKLSDRRTFKTQAFWDALQPVLDEYTAAGGQVIDEGSLDVALADDEVVALKLLIVLYPRTFTWEMDQGTVASFHQEIAKWIGWYDAVAGDKLRLELDFLQIDRRLPPLSCGPQGGNVYWMGFADVEADLAARGIPREYYDSVCCFWAWDRDVPSLPDGQPAAQAYGGAAQGPGTDVALLGAAGRTSYYGAAIVKSRFVTTGRVALHEYLHNLDAMFEMAGMPDGFYTSDGMAAYMPQQLAEQPGAYSALGYSDAEMLDLAEKEARGEASFPWRTQQVYYSWMLQRTPREHFAQLLARYGTRERQRQRTRLYDSYILPNAEIAYQIEFPVGAPREAPVLSPSGGEAVLRPQSEADSASAQRGAKAPPTGASAMHGIAPTGEGDLSVTPTGEGASRGAPTGLLPITIEDIDPEDGYVHWHSEALGGYVDDAALSTPVRRYREAEIVAPDYCEYVLGRDVPRFSASVRDTGSGGQLADARAGASFGGQLYALFADGAGNYALPLPPGLETETQVVLSAQAADYIISDNPLTLILRPAWSTQVEFRPNRRNDPPVSSPFEPGIHVALEGPPGNYQATLKFSPEWGTVLRRLFSEGVLDNQAVLDLTLSLDPGNSAYIELDRYTWEALQYLPGSLRVEYSAPDGTSASFVEHLAPVLPLGSLLGSITPDKLPGYIPRAIPLTPSLDGELAEWPELPSLSLTVDKGHSFNGSFSGPQDAALQLWLAYDADQLYVAGRVGDDFIKRGDMWGSDRLNLVFDARCDTTPATYPHGAVGHTGWEADDYWVLLCPFMSTGTGAPLTERLGGESASGKNGYFGAVKDARQAVVEEDGGWRFEWAIPLRELPYLKPAAGKFCGFSFFLSDHDAEGMAELMYLTDWGTASGIEWRYWDCGLLYFAP